MSVLTTTSTYDPVFDSQKNYRILMNSTARPGTIGLLDDVSLPAVPSLNRATVLIARTLFSGEISFFVSPRNDAASDVLREDTQAILGGVSEADFLILNGTDFVESNEALIQVKSGSLAFPDLGATVILQVDAISPAPLQGALKLRLTGPGIEHFADVFVTGVEQAFFEQLMRKNKEFPVGVDTFLTCDSLSAGPCVLGLPRTTRVDVQKI